MLEHYRRAFVSGQPVRKTSEALTSREREVLQLIAEGNTNKQIASELCISIKTVEKHRQQVMNRLNIHDIAGPHALRHRQGDHRGQAGDDCGARSPEKNAFSSRGVSKIRTSLSVILSRAKDPLRRADLRPRAGDSSPGSG